MPQAILFGLMGAGMYAGYRLARSITTARREAADLAAKAGQPAAAEARDMGTLRCDPKTGVYRTGV